MNLSLIFTRVCAASVIATVACTTAPAQESHQDASPEIRLGKRLYMEKNITNPASNFVATCYACHRPEWAPEGRRAYSDLLQYSLVPTDSFGGKKTTVRNTPTLMDIASHTRFGHDGRWTSLYDALKGEITSAHYGWFPDEREYALGEIASMLQHDRGVDQIAEGTYVEQFKRVYDVDLESAERDVVIDSIINNLITYISGFKSRRDSAYDAFLKINQFPEHSDRRGSKDETAAIRNHLDEINESGQLKIHDGFGVDAVTGMRLFFQNCADCHTPPLFTDFGFHNTGVAQFEYDEQHAEGAFAALAIPGLSESERPDPQFLPKVEAGKQLHPDLGYWNHTPADNDEALTAAIGAFKTPTLRNLQYTDPYMHNGAYASLEEAVAQKLKASRLAKAGLLRSADAALAQMDLEASDVAPLVAFLMTLTDQSSEVFEAQVESARSSAP